MADEPLTIGPLDRVEAPEDRLPVELYFERRWQAREGFDFERLLQEGPEREPPAEGEPGQPGAIPPEVLGRLEEEAREPVARVVLDKVLKTFTGLTLDETLAAVREGTLGAKVGLRLADPMGNLAEAWTREAAQHEGLPPELAQRVAGTTALLVGALFPFKGAKQARGAAKALQRAARGEAGDPEARRAIEAREVILGQPRPGEERRLNLLRVGAEADVKRAIASLDAALTPRLAESRKRVGHAEVAERAQRVTLGDVLESPIDEQLAARVTAVRDFRDAAAAEVVSLAKKIAAGDAVPEGAFMTAFAAASELTYRDELLGRAAARGLEIRRMLSDADRAGMSAERVADFVRRVQIEGATEGDLARALLAFEREGSRRTFLEGVAETWRRGSGALYEVWINALLSGPQTHVVNTVSNAIVAAWAIPERALAGLLHTGEAPGVARGEALAMLYGAIEGFTDGLRLAGRSLRTGERAFGAEKVERLPAISAETFGLAKDSWFGRAADFLGATGRMPTRMLGVEDAFFKGLNYRMELRALSLRHALAEGLEGDALAARVREIARNPGAFPELDAAAKHFALVQTFANELGPVGQALAAAVDKIPMGRVVAPFVRTPTQLAVYVKQRTPGLNLLGTAFWDDVGAGGARRDLALAKMAGGMLTTGTFAALATAGVVTGGGPSDRTLRDRLRETGWQPHSIKIGETYYGYNRLDPFGMMLGLVADYAEIAGHLPEGARLELAAALGLAMSKNMLSKTYMTGIADLLEAIEAPDKRTQKFLEGLARSAVPIGVRTVERTITDPTLRETRGLLDQIRAGVPGWSETLPPRRNLFGEPILLEGGLGPDLVSPVYVSRHKADPVADEIARLKVPLSMPSRVLFGTRPPALRMQPETAAEGVELTPGEYDLFVRLAGNELKDPGTGRGMKDTLAEIFQGREYQAATDGPEGGKALLVRRVVDRFRMAARAELIQQSPGLEDAFKARVAERARALGASEEAITQSLGR